MKTILEYINNQFSSDNIPNDDILNFILKTVLDDFKHYITSTDAVKDILTNDKNKILKNIKENDLRNILFCCINNGDDLLACGSDEQCLDLFKKYLNEYL